MSKRLKELLEYIWDKKAQMEIEGRTNERNNDAGL